jgi:hypothetical protein
VYVDGYLAGIVDDFDGIFQRLDLPPGEHDVTLFLDGYRTTTQRVLFRPGATIKIKYDLVPLAPGETAEPRPQPPPHPQQPPPYDGRGPARPAPPEEGRAADDFGTLAIRVQPRDATLLIDGEEWASSEGPGIVRIELGEGTHEVEVRKEGFSTFRRTVFVRAGETVSLNVSLSR